jgi:hypothetical protein
LDCGSDDTIFPHWIARRLGINLSGAPQGEAHPIGGTAIPFPYAAVTLRLTDGIETCEWRAFVGFVDLPLRWALLGNTGTLDFFDVELRGTRREVFINPNSSFAGGHIVHASPTP